MMEATRPAPRCTWLCLLVACAPWTDPSDKAHTPVDADVHTDTNPVVDPDWVGGLHAQNGTLSIACAISHGVGGA